MLTQILKKFSDNSLLDTDMVNNSYRYAVGEWYEWFAWYPVIHNDKLYWFRSLYRRTVLIKVIDITTYQYITLMEYLAQS
jgi:hypothetical protein